MSSTEQKITTFESIIVPSLIHKKSNLTVSPVIIIDDSSEIKNGPEMKRSSEMKRGSLQDDGLLTNETNSDTSVTPPLKRLKYDSLDYEVNYCLNMIVSKIDDPNNYIVAISLIKKIIRENNTPEIENHAGRLVYAIINYLECKPHVYVVSLAIDLAFTSSFYLYQPFWFIGFMRPIMRSEYRNAVIFNKEFIRILKTVHNVHQSNQVIVLESMNLFSIYLLYEDYKKDLSLLLPDIDYFYFYFVRNFESKNKKQYLNYVYDIVASFQKIRNHKSGLLINKRYKQIFQSLLAFSDENLSEHIKKLF